jgi:ABC-type nickel/cobalt efflux system permease component RcnA
MLATGTPLQGIILIALMDFIVIGAYLLVLSFTLWMAVDAAKQDRFWWIVCIIGLPVVGGAVYYFTEKKHEYAKISSHHIHDSETESQHETSHEHHEKKKSASRKARLKGRVEPHIPAEVKLEAVENKEEEKKEEKAAETEEVKIEEPINTEEKQA